MEAKLSYKEKELFGLIEFAPDTAAEYYALIRWLDHATACGLPPHMIRLQTPLGVKEKKS